MDSDLASAATDRSILNHAHSHDWRCQFPDANHRKEQTVPPLHGHLSLEFLLCEYVCMEIVSPLLMCSWICITNRLQTLGRRFFIFFPLLALVFFFFFFFFFHLSYLNSVVPNIFNIIIVTHIHMTRILFVNGEESKNDTLLYIVQPVALKHVLLLHPLTDVRER